MIPIKTLPVLLLTAVLMTSVASSVDMMQDAYAAKSRGEEAPGRVSPQSYGSATQNKVCGDVLCSEYPGGREAFLKEMGLDIKSETKQDEKQTKQDTKSETKQDKEEKMKKAHAWKIESDTITSEQDPAKGHETHNLAVILPPSENIYKGILTYDASENVQLVALHGPLNEGEAKGQPIWELEDGTKYALTFIEPETSAGSWMFAGNAVALHTKKPDPFTVTYSVSYMEKSQTDLVKTGTVESDIDPGLGHEQHSLAVILPPSENLYSGLVTFAASESVQLVALHGPLSEDEINGQKIWQLEDGTKFGLTFVDKGKAADTWAFAGNALALHTLNPDGFTASYTVVASQN